jgi:uncharacterized protein (DUF427 family)
VRIEHRGVVLADTTAAWQLLETSHPPTYYLPPADVATSKLVPSRATSYCEFKGVARYWTVRLDGVDVADAAWSYPDPTPGYEVLRDHLAFYATPFDGCFVGADRAHAQPGGFYGGWVTSAWVGPFKGEPGTSGW